MDGKGVQHDIGNLERVAMYMPKAFARSMAFATCFAADLTKYSAVQGVPVATPADSSLTPFE